MKREYVTVSAYKCPIFHTEGLQSVFICLIKYKKYFLEKKLHNPTRFLPLHTAHRNVLVVMDFNNLICLLYLLSNMSRTACSNFFVQIMQFLFKIRRSSRNNVKSNNDQKIEC